MKIWKQTEHPEMRFMSWEKRQVALWLPNRDQVQKGDLIHIVMNSGLYGEFKVVGVYRVPRSKDALILQVRDVGYVQVSEQDRIKIEQIKQAQRAAPAPTKG